ncbi:MAG: paraquat-inducible protein A [Gammaproteobacteria bacterium]|nr:paraquat-inducible protein A [Gammaproteobacteria bacterium]
MTLRSILALVLILASLACLYPGLFQDMLTIRVGKEVPFLGYLDLYEATQSIMQTIETLFVDQNYLVAWLILIFSVVVPVAKILLLLVVLFSPNERLNDTLFQFVSAIGKWSMADVFVVSIFMAALATKSNEAVSATLHSGYYYFTAYCLLSILGTQLIQRPKESSIVN